MSEILLSDTIRIVRHTSAIEPIGEPGPDGIAMSRYEHLKWLSDRDEIGERIHGEVVVEYQSIKLVWDHAMETGDFSNLSEDFLDAMAAIEVLIQREQVVEYYKRVFGEEPKPILT
jgi:hypothetical protein